MLGSVEDEETRLVTTLCCPTGKSILGRLRQEVLACSVGVSPMARSEHVIVAPTLLASRRNGHLAEISNSHNRLLDGPAVTERLTYRTGFLAGSGKSVALSQLPFRSASSMRQSPHQDASATITLHIVVKLTLVPRVTLSRSKHQPARPLNCSFAIWPV